MCILWNLYAHGLSRTCKFLKLCWVWNPETLSVVTRISEKLGAALLGVDHSLGRIDVLKEDLFFILRPERLPCCWNMIEILRLYWYRFDKELTTNKLCTVLYQFSDSTEINRTYIRLHGCTIRLSRGKKTIFHLQNFYEIDTRLALS